MTMISKTVIRAYIRLCIDKLRRTPFARPSESEVEMIPIIRLSQPFKPSETLENKKHNLREASRCINRLVIRPGEVFSFWHTVGNPNNSRRFKAGRTIHNGVVKLDLGGGLCQASGIIHHLAILADLEIIERHSHSVDLYTDESRFAPLGTDATVFYGYKDFRFRNNTGGDLRIEIQIYDEEIIATLFSQQHIVRRVLATDIHTLDDGRKRVVITDAFTGGFVNESVYH